MLSLYPDAYGEPRMWQPPLNEHNTCTVQSRNPIPSVSSTPPPTPSPPLPQPPRPARPSPCPKAPRFARSTLVIRTGTRRFNEAENHCTRLPRIDRPRAFGVCIFFRSEDVGFKPRQVFVFPFSGCGQDVDPSAKSGTHFMWVQFGNSVLVQPTSSRSKI